MRKTIIGIVGGSIVLVAIFSQSCSTIEPGYVGIVVNQYGSQRGVSDYPLRTGRVWVNPITQKVYEYPTFQQTVSWTIDKNEGRPVDESMSFNSKEGTVISADVSLSYSFVPEKVPELFVEFKQDAETFSHGYMRSQVRDAFNRVGSTLPVIGIFGEQKQELLDGVKHRLEDVLEPKGLHVDMIALIGSPRVAQAVQDSINNVIKATQDAQAAENKVRQSKAEAEQQIAKADGEAQATLRLAQAQAEANNLLAKSLTPQVIQYQAMQKWNGQLPQVSGSGATPFISVK
jgi:regulator of protease activity HflC (stomatin/prohibitin superfamily)